MTTRERILWVLVLVTFFCVVGTRAQNPLATNAYETYPNPLPYSVSACPTPTTGYVALCTTSAGPYYITSAGVATNLLPGAAAPAVLKFNGTAPGTTGTVTCTAALPTEGTAITVASGDVATIA